MNNNKVSRLVVAIIIILIAGFYVGVSLGYQIEGKELKSLKREAVERGCAEYEVDSDGGTTWHWIEKDGE